MNENFTSNTLYTLACFTYSNEHSYSRINLIYFVIISENKQFQRCVFKLYILE